MTKKTLDPAVLASMERHLVRLINDGTKKISPRKLLEDARVELKLPGGINNNLAAAYNRAIRERRPDLAPFLSPLRKAVDQSSRERVKELEAQLDEAVTDMNEATAARDKANATIDRMIAIANKLETQLAEVAEERDHFIVVAQKLWVRAGGPIPESVL